MGQGTEKWLLTFRWMLWPAPAGLLGGLKLEAYHQSRQPQSFFLCGPRCSGTSDRCSGRCGVIFLRAVAAAVSSSRRCGDFGLVSRHKPAEHRFLMFPLLPTLQRRVSHAEERLRNQRFFYMQGSGCEINASHTQGSGCENNASHTQGCACEINASLSLRRRQHVMARPRASRSSSHRASGGRGVGV